MDSRPQDRRSQRVKWLRDHPAILQMSRRDLLRSMRDAGVLSVKTNKYDVNLYNLMLDAGYGRRNAAKFSLVPWLHGGR